MTRDELTVTILDATEEALARYLLMSGGKTVHDHAVETFVSSMVAERVYDDFGNGEITVSLEAPFAEVLAASGTTGDRPPTQLSDWSRFDICVYRRNKPKAVIEVKKRFTASRGDRDVNRLMDAIRCCGPDCGGSLKWGFWLAVQRIATNSRTTPRSQIKAFLDSFDWPTMPTVKHRTLSGDFGQFRRSGRLVQEIRIFLAIFSS